MSLRGRLIDVPLLTLDQRRSMFALFDAHYLSATWAKFSADLAEKQWVILIEEAASGQLRGFSTQMILEVPHRDQMLRVLFSGDTVIDRAAWGDQALAGTWGKFALGLVHQMFPEPLYWLLVSKGYKTYRFLPLFFHEFYPRFDRPTPPWAAEMLAVIARHKFGETYDPSRGVVRGGETKDRLRPGVADLTPERLCDPHVRFFADHNPAHAHGDELCCLAPLSPANFTKAAWRVIGQPRRTLERQSCPLPAG